MLLRGGFAEAVSQGGADAFGGGEGAEHHGAACVVEGAEAGVELGGQCCGVGPRAPCEAFGFDCGQLGGGGELGGEEEAEAFACVHGGGFSQQAGQVGAGAFHEIEPRPGRVVADADAGRGQ